MKTEVDLGRGNKRRLERMEYTQRLSLRYEFLENSQSRAWTLIASAGFQFQPTPTCLGLKGFVVVVVVVEKNCHLTANLTFLVVGGLHQTTQAMGSENTTKKD